MVPVLPLGLFDGSILDSKPPPTKGKEMRKKEIIKSLASQYRLLGEFIRRSKIIPFTVGLQPCKSMLIVHLDKVDFLNLFSIKECQSFEDRQGVTLAATFRGLYITTFIPPLGGKHVKV